MSNIRRGYQEELVRKSGEYPGGYTVQLPPDQQGDDLINQTLRMLGDRLREDLKTGTLQPALDRVHQVLNVIGTPDTPLEDPLAAAHFRLDGKQPLSYPALTLSSPSFLFNEGRSINGFFRDLALEMATADRVDILVSFVRWSGLQLLLQGLEELVSRGAQVRILTSTYMDVTEPKALRALLAQSGIQTKLYLSGRRSFHTKAYLFGRDSGLNTLIIGSSNISHMALSEGEEWNLRLPEWMHPTLYSKAMSRFEQLWDAPEARALTLELISGYESHRQAAPTRSASFTASGIPIEPSERDTQDRLSPDLFEPNSMQVSALKALAELRHDGESKALVVAATGTGKTVLAALDVQRFAANRLLFVAHREELLDCAKETFALILGNPSQCGKLTGTEKDWDSPFLFATVQTLTRPEVLERFNGDSFDYLVVDEFHHAAADTYQRILAHFQPRFLLGLTATPERMDGADILKAVDNNVAYEIRLRDALNADILAPFHYFGVADETVDYGAIPMSNGTFLEDALGRALATEERAQFILATIKRFGFELGTPRALAFCATVEHAHFMAAAFRRNGHVALSLSGENSVEERQAAIKRLTDPHDPLTYLFTVNIFNEGVDIPEVDLVLFLRPTESPTIFLQQLGRGLRKAPGKEFLTVLDFIGNHHRAFVVALALSGQHNAKAFERDSLRVAIESSFVDLPPGCFVQLTEIARKTVLDRIDGIRMDSVQMLKELYRQFRKELGRPPELRDFFLAETAPPLHAFLFKWETWIETKQKMQDLSPWEEQVLQDTTLMGIVRRLESALPLRWPYGYVALLLAIRSGATVSTADVQAELRRRFHLDTDLRQHVSRIDMALAALTHEDEKGPALCALTDHGLVLMPAFTQAIQEPKFAAYVEERLHHGLLAFRRQVGTGFFSADRGLVLYQNYTRKQIQFLYEVTGGAWREGVARVDSDYLLFVNLKKDESVAEHLAYHDYFMDAQHFHWQSQNATSHDSSRGQDYVHQKAREIRVHLFVRKFEKQDGQVQPFTYLGLVDYESSHGDKPMNIVWRLHQPLPDDLLIDLTR